MIYRALVNYAEIYYDLRYWLATKTDATVYYDGIRVSARLHCQLIVVITNRQSQILTWHDHLACQH